MQEIADRASISIPYGLEFVLIVAALTFVVLVACALPIVFALRRWIVPSSASAEHDNLKGRIDLLRAESRRTARPSGDPSLAASFHALFSRYRHDPFRKEARND